MTKPKVAIIILNWNGKEDTLACLQSLQALTYTNAEIILVDNGSTDDSVAAFKQAFPAITLLENRENLGFAEGNNVGIRYALEKGADYIFLLNNDTVVDPGILDRFVEAMQGNPKASILGGKIYLHERPTTFDHLGGIWNPSKAQFDLIANRDLDDGQTWEKELPVDYICGAALFAKAEIYRKIGLLEPQFFLYWEEADWCYRAKKEGFRAFYTPRPKLWHKVSASMTGGSPQTLYYWWRNRLLFIERNCTPQERRKLYKNILKKEMRRLGKHLFLKEMQYRLTLAKKSRLRRLERLKRYRASLKGVKDYFRRDFGKLTYK